MAAPGAWYRKGRVNVTKDSKVIIGDKTDWKDSPTPPAAGDIMTFNHDVAYEVIQIVSNTELHVERGYEGETATNLQYAIIRNTSATINSRLAAQVTKALNQKQIMIDDQNNWLVSTNPTETFTDALGNELEVKTPFQMQKDVDDAVSKIKDSSRAMSEADMETEIAHSEKTFAASGFPYFGKHYSSGNSLPINEGMYSRISAGSENILWLGRTGITPSASSKSLKNMPVISIAGIATNFEGADIGQNQPSFPVKSPERADGTKTYDSENGIIFDYLNQVDPKYGNKPSGSGNKAYNEAVARAFAGMAKNHDVRLGDDGSWEDGNNGARGTLVVTEGKMTVTDTTGGTPQQGSMTVRNTHLTSYKKDKTYVIELIIESETVADSVFVRTGTYGDPNIGYVQCNVGYNKFEWTPGQDANNASSFLIYIANKSTVVINSYSVTPKTTEVVINPVYMWGFESYLELITPKNPQVSYHGITQSKVKQMDGITTKKGTRPVTYYAVFDGDDSSVGQELDFFAISVIERDAVLNNPNNRIYRMKNGGWVQRKVRQRTIGGAGNGDWRNISSVRKGNIYFRDSNKSRIYLQGAKDSIPVFGGYDGLNLMSANWASFNDGRHKNLDAALLAPESANASEGAGNVNGDGFFLVCGTVSGLNQGAYHPRSNRHGASRWQDYGQNTNDWHAFSNRDAEMTTKQSFIIAEKAGDFGRNKDSGKIGSTKGSGRPDGRFFDGVYEGGLGGVIDHRLSSWDASGEEKKIEVENKINDFTYRGSEKLTSTHVVKSQFAISGSRLYWKRAEAELKPLKDKIQEITDGAYSLLVGQEITLNKEKYKIIGQESGLIFKLDRVVDTTGLTSVDVGSGWRMYSGKGDIIFISSLTNTSVSGVFSRMDVSGDPELVYKTPQLNQGWLGGWTGHIFDGIKDSKISLTRKAVLFGPTDVRVTHTKDNGKSWTSDTTGIAGVNNEINTSLPVGTVRMDVYSAFAKQTIESDNLPLPSDVGSVVSFHANHDIVRGNIIMESLSGLIGKSSRTSDFRFYKVQSGRVPVNGNIIPLTQYVPTHSPLDISEQDNGSPSLKILISKDKKLNQATLRFNWNEVKYTGSSFGNLKEINIVGNTGMYTDDNGVNCLAGTAILALPYGWIKKEG